MAHNSYTSNRILVEVTTCLDGEMKKVLVLDDDPSIQELLKLALESEGYHVTLAADGLIGLERLQESAPDVIVVDLMMPRMGGAAFAEELKRLAPDPPIPILVLSAATKGREQAHSMEAEAYIEKPFALNDLLTEVARLAA